MRDYSLLEKKAALIRKWSLISTSEAGSGHPTSCLSAADITTVLFDQFFTYDLNNPHNIQNDRIIFSKGHAAPLLYTLFAVSGALPLEQLKTLRKFDSPLEGHPTPNFPYTEAATGSLGQGLSVGAGLAYGIQKENLKFIHSASSGQSSKLPKVYVLLGDGELAEGSIWEAANFSSYYKLNNLIGIADINGFGQSQKTMFGNNTTEYANRFRAFGWETLQIDGHNFEQIQNAFEKAVNNTSKKPFVIVANTKKGKGISFLEGKDGLHGKALKKEDLEKALEELGEVNNNLMFALRSPRQFENSSNASVPAVAFGDLGIRPPSATLVKNFSHVKAPRANLIPLIPYRIGEQIATREVYGKVLASLGKQDETIYALDGDVKNSTFAQDFKKVHPDRFIECFIAEQNMVGVALGLSRLGKTPFVSTFAAFLTRAFDQIRMAELSKANITFVGSHSGVSIGEDGSSQMGLEDIAMFGALPGSIIFHPSDAVSTAKIIPLLVDHYGISYLRTLRPKTPVLYNSNEDFVIGGSKILRKSKNDVLTVIAMGITVFEALEAYEILKKDGVVIRVVDCYCVKPIDQKTLQQCIKQTLKQCLVTVEDHFEHGGLGDFVLEAVSHSGAFVEKMAVSQVSHSGTKEELLSFAEIDSAHIVKKIKSLL